MDISETAKKNIYLYLSFLIIAIVFLLRFSTSTSPLFIENGNDSAVFLMLGRFFHAGYTPYADFFDHKGPILIFIEALGYYLSPQNGRLGIFILQIINLFIIQLLIFKTAKLYLSNLYSYTTVIISLLFLRFTIEGGNLSEEYSLIFLILSLYITFKYYLSTNSFISNKSMFLLGICAAVIIWIRLNNTATICACLIFIIIDQIKEYGLKRTFLLFLSFLVGLVCISIPIILFFIYKNAFIALIDANFLFNLKYLASNNDDSVSIFDSVTSIIEYLSKSTLPFIVLFLGVIIEYKRIHQKKILLLGILLFIFSWLASQMGNLYYHYMMINIPCLVLGLTLIFKFLLEKHNSKQQGRIIACLSVVLLITLIIYGFNKRLKKSEDNIIKINEAQSIVNLIPQTDYNSVYTYCVRPFYLPSLPILPSYKYFIQQEWHAIADPTIIEQIDNMLLQDSPKWVITQFRAKSSNYGFWKILDQKYMLYAKTKDFELYHLKN